MKTLQELRAELKIVREYHYALRSAGKGVKFLFPTMLSGLLKNVRLC